MTPAEIDLLYRAADAEFNASETAMLVAPAALLALIDQLHRCERQRYEAGRYDIVSEPADLG